MPRLRQFVVVAREQHLTRAAELLGIPQPTLSRSMSRLRAGEIDLCLTAPLPDDPQVCTQALTEQRIDLFVPAGHRLARRQCGVRLAEAAAEDFIAMEPGYGLRAITDELCRLAGFEPRGAAGGGEQRPQGRRRRARPVVPAGPGERTLVDDRR